MMSKVSVSSKIYKALFKAKEIEDNEYDNVREWIIDIIENPNQPKRYKCEICNSMDIKLEMHHIRRHKNGNETITVCLECHKELTDKQRLWDKSWLNSDSEDKETYLIRGLIDLCELKYDKTHQEIYKLISEKLTEGFTHE